MEKNRIRPVKAGKGMRMSYSRQKEVLQMPNLIEVQKDSYQWFLDEGLKEAFADISPIADYSGHLSLEFVDFTLCEDDVKYTIPECKERDATYAAPLKVKVRLHNKEKDETDMFLAYRIGARCEYTDFVILGGTGGRLDHTYANLSILLYAKDRGHNITMIDEKSMIICIKNESVRLTGNLGAYLSVFAIGGNASGVSIKGAKYEVENVDLSPAFPLGVSNEFTNTEALISVEEGALLIIAE